MYKIAIVDDEAFSRMDVKGAIDFAGLELECVWEAANGKDALDKMNSDCPDILLLDVVMPEMDGIEVLHHIGELHDCPKVIMLSCHDEYLFVREALKLGAEDYILKQSLNQEELTLLLRKTIDKLSADSESEERTGEKRSTQKDRLWKGLSDPEGWRMLEEWEPLLARRLQTEGFYVISIDLHPAQSHNRKIMGQLVEQIFLEYGGCMCLETEELEEAVVFCGSRNDAAIEQIAARVNYFFYLYFNVKVVIGAAVHATGAERLYASYQAAGRMTEYHFYKEAEEVGSGIYLMWQCPVPGKKISDGILRESMELRKMMEYEDREVIWTHWQSLNERMRREQLRPGKCKEINMEIIYTLIRKRCDTYIHEIEDSICADIVQMESYEKMISYLFTLLNQMWDFMRKNDRRLRSEISFVMKYIGEHYNEDLSLTLMARKTNLGSNYFGTLFKRETGVSLTDYINTMRINRAKELLANGCQVQEVTYLVGFNSISYFSRLFKKMTNRSPKEYADSCRHDMRFALPSQAEDGGKGED